MRPIQTNTGYPSTAAAIRGGDAINWAMTTPAATANSVNPADKSHRLCSEAATIRTAISKAETDAAARSAILAQFARGSISQANNRPTTQPASSAGARVSEP